MRVASHARREDLAGDFKEVAPNSTTLLPLARLDAADSMSTPEAQKQFEEYHQRCGAVVQSAFHYHYARLIEATWALERIGMLLDDPRILDTRVRARAGVNSLEGVGMIEAPRGTLIHHYKVNEKGAHRVGQPDRRHGPQ